MRGGAAAPGGAGAQVSAAPASPGLCSGGSATRGPEGHQRHGQVEGHAVSPASRASSFREKIKSLRVGRRLCSSRGSRCCWRGEDAEEANNTRVGRCTLKANSFPFEIPEFQSTDTATHGWAGSQALK